MHVTNIIGAAAAAVATIQLIPQVRKVAAARSADDVSGVATSTFLLILGSEGLWLVYNTMISNWWGAIASTNLTAATVYISARTTVLRRRRQAPHTAQP